LTLDAYEAEEVGLSAQLVEPLVSACRLEIPNRTKARRKPRLVLEHLEEVPRVLSHPGKGVRCHPSRDDQAGGVPGRAGRELVAFEEHHIPPPEFGEVIGDAGTDHAATDDDDL